MDSPGGRWDRLVCSQEAIVLDAATTVPVPVNEPVRGYAPGSPGRIGLEGRLKELAAEPVELTMTIGGRQRMGGGAPVDVVQPHRHAAVVGTLRTATADDVGAAVAAAKAAAPGWQALTFDDRAAVPLVRGSRNAGGRVCRLSDRVLSRLIEAVRSSSLPQPMRIRA